MTAHTNAWGYGEVAEYTRKIKSLIAYKQVKAMYSTALSAQRCAEIEETMTEKQYAKFISRALYGRSMTINDYRLIKIKQTEDGHIEMPAHVLAVLRQDGFVYCLTNV